MLLACKLVFIIFSVLFIVFIPFSKQSILQSSKLDKLSSEIWCRDKDAGGFNESIKHFSIDIEETDMVCNYDPANVYEVGIEKLKDYAYNSDTIRNNITIRSSASQLQPNWNKFVNKKLKDGIMNDRFEVEINDKIYITSPQLSKKLSTDVLTEIYGKEVSSYNKNIEDDLIRYATVFNKMQSNEDLILNGNTIKTVLSLYFLVKKSMQLKNYLYLNSQDKFNIEYLERQLQSDIKQLVKEKLKGDLIKDRFEMSSEITDKIYLTSPQLLKVIITEVVNDVYGKIDTEKILSLVSSYSKNIEEDIAWYSSIFEKMKSTGDLSSNHNTIDSVLKLFVLVKQTMNYLNYAKIESTDKYILTRLRDQLKVDIISFAKNVIKEGILNDNFETASEIADQIYISQSDLSKEIIKEVVNEVYGIVETDKILDLIRNHSKNIEEDILWYMEIFSKIKSNSDLNLNENAVGPIIQLKLLFLVEQTMEFDSYEKVDYHDKSTLQNLKRELITSINRVTKDRLNDGFFNDNFYFLSQITDQIYLVDLFKNITEDFDFDFD